MMLLLGKKKRGNDANYDRYLSCHTHGSLVTQLIINPILNQASCPCNDDD